MKLENYTRIKLLTDRYQDHGVPKGSIGYIIEIYDTGDYELEFSREDGTTLALFAAKPHDVEAAESKEL